VVDQNGTAIADALLLAIVIVVGLMARSRRRDPLTIAVAGLATSAWILFVGPWWLGPAAAPVGLIGLMGLGWMVVRSALRPTPRGRSYR
jgi:hypothetical protein